MSMNGMMPRDVRKAWFAGLIVLAIAAMITYLAFTANQGRPLFSQPAQLKAVFNNVGQLAPEDEVRENSRRIGKVTDIELLPDHRVMVTMDLEGDPEVYGNAEASLRDQSVLGKKYVELDFGDPSQGPLPDRVINSVRPHEQAQDISQLFDVFDPQTRKSLSRSVRELGTGTAGHGRDLNDFLGAAPNLLADVQRISQAAASPEANLMELLRSTDRLASRFQGRAHELTALVENVNGTLEAINVDGAEPLGNTINHLPDTLGKARGAMDSLRGPLADTRAAMTDLQDGARALGAATPDVRGVLREGMEPVHKIPGVAEKANPAVDDLSHTFVDLRPFVPRVSEAVNTAVKPLSVIAPYAEDIAITGHDFSTLLGGFGKGDFRHALRVSLALPGGTLANGLTPVPSLPYSKPGESRAVKAPGGNVLSFLDQGEGR